jgi:hypothetical protein
MASRRERVGRTSTAVEAGVKKEWAHSVDPAMVGEALTWTQRWWRRRSVEADAEEEWAHGMDPAAVGEAVKAWRRSMSGADGDEMIPPRLGFKWAVV